MNTNKYRKIMIGILGIIVIALVFLVIIDLYQTKNKDQTVTSRLKPEKPVTLQYYTWDEEESYMRPMVESFNAQNPNIQINMSVIKSDDYDKGILNLVKRNQSPDIIGVRGISQMSRYESYGILADLSNYILDSSIDITAYGNMYNDIAVDGKYYGVPTRTTCWVLIYNKDIFDEMNEPYPGQLTWEEYASLAKKMKHIKEDGTVIWGGYFAVWAMNFAGIQNGSYLYDDDPTYQIKSLELYNQFMNIDKSHIGVEAIEENYWLTTFEEGRAAMMPMGEWAVGMIMSDERQGKAVANWDLAPMPIFKGMNPGTTWGQYQFTGITQACEHKDAAFEFLSYVGGADGAKIFAEYGMLSAYNSSEVREIYQKAVGDKNISVFFDALRIQEIPVFESYEDINQVFSDVGKEYLGGKITLEEAMRQYESEREKIIKNQSG